MKKQNYPPPPGWENVKPGDRIRMSQHGLETLPPRNQGGRFGVLDAFCKQPRQIRVRRDTAKSFSYWGTDYWEPIPKAEAP